MGFDTIWRAALEPQPKQMIDMPIGAQVLAVKQRPRSEGSLLRPPIAEMWYRCNPEMDLGPLPVKLVGTGWPECPDTHMRYVDSIFFNDGREVYHVFVGDAWDSSGALSSHTVHLSYAERAARGLASEPEGLVAMPLRERIDAYMPSPPPAPSDSPST